MIVVAGEALIDLIPTPAGDLGIHPGGGPFNTARWLGRLGADVGFLGALAADPLGQRLSDQLVEAGVGLDQVVVSERPTTLALAHLDAVGAAQYSFYTDTSMSDVWPSQVDELLPESLDALYVGSIGLVLEPAASAGLRAVELARARGALVMVDPNVRASLIGDRAAYLARLDAVLGSADVLKLSVEDLAWLAPGEPSVGRGPTFARPRSAGRAADRRGRRRDGLHGLRWRRADRAGDGRGGGHDRRGRRLQRRLPGPLARPPRPIRLREAKCTPTVHFASRIRIGKQNRSPGPVSLPASGLVDDGSGLVDAGSGLVDAGSGPGSGSGDGGVVEAARFAARVAAVACSVQGATPPADLGALLDRDQVSGDQLSGD